MSESNEMKECYNCDAPTIECIWIDNKYVCGECLPYYLDGKDRK